MSWTLLDGAKWILGLVGLLNLMVESAVKGRLRGSGRTGRTSLALIALTVGTWVVRRIVVVPGFFQHAGRGADWVCMAYDGRGLSYGPGFFETFGPVVSLFSRDPDRALFEAQTLLGACVPALAWITVRFTSGRATFASALAVVVALHPALARAAASESYYATCAFFLFAGAASLALATHRARLTSTSYLGCVSGALLLAQAVALHPMCWLQAGCVPLVAACGRGSTRSRAKSFAQALTLSSIACVGQLARIIAVRGHLVGENAVAGFFGMVLFEKGGVILPLTTLAAALVLVIRARTSRRDSLRIAIAAVVASVQIALQLAGLLDLPSAAAFSHAFLAAPSVFAALAALFARTRRTTRIAAAVVLATSFVTLVPLAPGMLALTTESLESNWLIARRRSLPSEAVVAFVTERGVVEMKLPLYGACGLPGAEAREVSGSDPTTPGVRPTHYYRSSLCSTPDGRPHCEAYERGLRLQLLASARFPARATKVKLEVVSSQWLPIRTPFGYLAPNVEVALFSVVGDSPRLRAP